MKRTYGTAAAVVIGMAWSIAVTAADVPAAAPTTPSVPKEVAAAYPGLASGALTHALLADLPGGVLMKSGETTLTEKDLAAVSAGAPEKIRGQLDKNAFFVLENVAASRLLLGLAKQEAARTGRDIAALGEQEVVEGYLKGLLDGIEVSDSEVQTFYEDNKAMFGGAKLDAVKPQIAPYLRQQKQQDALRELVKSLGRKLAIEVSAPWVKAQSVLARDNPVDKARFSGIPTMVDFGREGCGPCDMMAPFLKTLKEKYKGKANIIFVHTGEEEILAMRHGIEVVPVQVFYDKDGKEVFRHSGFFAQAEIEKKLAEIGVK